LKHPTIVPLSFCIEFRNRAEAAGRASSQSTRESSPTSTRDRRNPDTQSGEIEELRRRIKELEEALARKD